MKKLFIFLISLLFVVNLTGQSRDVASALKSYEKAKTAIENPKKNTNPKTWNSLAEAALALHDAPVKTLWIGASQVEIKVLLKDERVNRSERVKIGEDSYTVDYYSDKKLYYDNKGFLALWEIVEPPLDEPLLDVAYDALNKGIELDAPGRLKDVLRANMDGVKVRYNTEAMANYTLHKYGTASNYFEKVLQVGNNPILGSVDTVFYYYTGMTAFLDKNFKRAIEFFNLSVENGYDESGDVYSYLAESYKALSNMDMAKVVLNQGFAKYPSAQSILVSLINAYLDTNDDPNKILELISVAQKNEPDNASLFYAEGNIWKNLGNYEQSVECYKKSTVIDPTYIFGYFALGAAYYDKAVEIQTKAVDELDDAKYQVMLAELEDNLIKAIEPFEKTFELSQDAEINNLVAEYLKNIFFRFREKSEEYKENYEKYNSYAKEHSKK